MKTEENFYIVNAMGQDRAGLIAVISKVVSDANFNIIDIEQSAPHGLFYLIMIIEPTKTAISDPIGYFNKHFEELSTGIDLNISIKPFSGGIRKRSKLWLDLIFVGPDRPGLISAISDYAGKHNANIHRLNMISRGEIIACECLLDISSLDINRDDFNTGLSSLGEELGLQIIIESKNVFKKKVNKLLIVDLDDHLIQIQGFMEFFSDVKDNDTELQIIKNIISADNSQEMKKLSISYLKGMEIEILKQIISSIMIYPGTEEFIRALKLMQYRIALISNSISFFTDFLKEQLNLEYAFGNAIEIDNGIITGKFIEKIEINTQKKQKLINWLATMEKIPEAEVIKFGLGEKEKDSILAHSADLKIDVGFNYNNLQNLLDQRKCSISQIFSVFIAIGIQDSQLKKFLTM
jgi:phosphoserine phosphatase